MGTEWRIELGKSGNGGSDDLARVRAPPLAPRPGFIRIVSSVGTGEAGYMRKVGYVALMQGEGMRG